MGFRRNIAQAVWLMNQHNQHTSSWGVPRDDLDRVEEKYYDKGIPLMHTWRYQQSYFPKTTAHTHAFGMPQVPTGYKWIMDFTIDSIEVAQVIMAEVRTSKLVHWWSTLVAGSPVPYFHDNMVRP